MAVSFPIAQVAVSSTPAAVFTGWTSGSLAVDMALKNLGPETVYVGPANVTPTTGFPISAGEVHVQAVVGSSVTGGRELYAVTAGGGSTLAYMRGT